MCRTSSNTPISTRIPAMAISRLGDVSKIRGLRAAVVPAGLVIAVGLCRPDGLP